MITIGKQSCVLFWWIIDCVRARGSLPREREGRYTVSLLWPFLRPHPRSLPTMQYFTHCWPSPAVVSKYRAFVRAPPRREDNLLKPLFWFYVKSQKIVKLCIIRGYSSPTRPAASPPPFHHHCSPLHTALSAVTINLAPPKTSLWKGTPCSLKTWPWKLSKTMY